jgi:hypothetical protein
MALRTRPLPWQLAYLLLAFVLFVVGSYLLSLWF